MRQLTHAESRILAMNPRAPQTLKDNIYMDGILDSVNTVNEVEKLSCAIDDILANGGFKVKEWLSNGDLTGKRRNQDSSGNIRAESTRDRVEQ